MIIDSDVMTATKGGVNVVKYVDAFIALEPGGNELAYTDSESARTVEIRVTHTPRDL
ncbi:MAG: hypothetical protein JRD89_06030 [Deltaproteobacteria bacterium]|nr:hypothetical protein [Deltaproteobacteria bacterium]